MINSSKIFTGSLLLALLATFQLKAAAGMPVARDIRWAHIAIGHSLARLQLRARDVQVQAHVLGGVDGAAGPLIVRFGDFSIEAIRQAIAAPDVELAIIEAFAVNFGNAYQFCRSLIAFARQDRIVANDVVLAQVLEGYVATADDLPLQRYFTRLEQNINNVEELRNFLNNPLNDPQLAAAQTVIPGITWFIRTFLDRRAIETELTGLLREAARRAPGGVEVALPRGRSRSRSRSRSRGRSRSRSSDSLASAPSRESSVRSW